MGQDEGILLLSYHYAYYLNNLECNYPILSNKYNLIVWSVFHLVLRNNTY